jgi:lipopolysaccharide export system ATP-binding protein
MSILSAEHLQKSYKKKVVLKDVSIRVESGEVVGLLGPNGAGKTTSFYMIVGLIACDAGKITLDEHDITEAPMHVRARTGIGYLAQEASIFQKLSVEENIQAVLEIRKDLNSKQQAEKLEALIADFQTNHVRHSLGISLSGGERRRVEIARALATEPSFILLDEPFAGIDPISVLEIQKIVTHLTERNIGVLITDHNVRETLNICHRAYILSEGTILAEGSPNEIVNNTQVKKVYLGENFRA